MSWHTRRRRCNSSTMLLVQDDISLALTGKVIHIILEKYWIEINHYWCRQLCYRPSHPQLFKATARLIIWKRGIWYTIIRIPKIGVWGTKYNYMFNVYYNALHILSLSPIDLEGRSVARHLAATPCSVSRTTAGQGGSIICYWSVLMICAPIGQSVR